MTKPDRIVFIHSLNNFTGSPNVLSVVIKGFLKKGYKVDLITSHGDGFLSNIKGVNYTYTCYKWHASKWETFQSLMRSQVEVFIKIAFYPRSGTIYYLNTITPFGAAWACYLTGKKVIYHVHENMQLNKPIYWLFRSAYKHCNHKSIFVSNYLKSTALKCKEGKVIYNGLDPDFVMEAEKYFVGERNNSFNILMVAKLQEI